MTGTALFLSQRTIKKEYRQKQQDRIIHDKQNKAYDSVIKHHIADKGYTCLLQNHHNDRCNDHRCNTVNSHFQICDPAHLPAPHSYKTQYTVILFLDLQNGANDQDLQDCKCDQDQSGDSNNLQSFIYLFLALT